MNIVDRQLKIDRALSKLASLTDSGVGIVEAVACGDDAISALRSLLFQRTPSGLSHSRCRAIDALAALKAFDVIFEYLEDERQAVDPIERLGDDAVINYAAWALSRTREERAFALLLRLARRPALSGVIGALGTFGRVEAIPPLVEALEEDGSRTVAEFMLRRMGQAAREALLRSAGERKPSVDHESVSSRRRRRSSLSVLADIGLSESKCRQLKKMMEDADLKVAVLACKLWLLYAPATERMCAIDRLINLLPSADWLMQQEIDDCLGIVRITTRAASMSEKTMH
jgi:HEAT repeat protein